MNCSGIGDVGGNLLLILLYSKAWFRALYQI